MANEKRLIKVVDATKVYNGIALYMAENAYLNDTPLDVLKMVANWLNEAPTMDAVEVVHGRWLYDSGRGKYFCSACNEDALSFKKDTIYGGYLYEVCLADYCPDCGAKMDKNENP